MNSYLADSMLGKLSRWLRILGYYVEYVTPEYDDDRIIRICTDGSLVLLTRDRELSQRYERSILFQDDDLASQIKKVVSFDPPDENLFFSRCSLCNGILTKANPGDIQYTVPEDVLRRKLDIYVCTKCGKVYWKGSHYNSMMRQIEAFLGGNGNDSGTRKE
ncbi:MAG: Mut7-C RNAse domain-containing protein [Thermoplasmataceae archaeon]